MSSGGILYKKIYCIVFSRPFYIDIPASLSSALLGFFWRIAILMLDMRGLIHKREKWSFNKDGNEIERSNWDGVSWHTIRRPLARDGIFSGVVLFDIPFSIGRNNTESDMEKCEGMYLSKRN